MSRQPAIAPSPIAAHGSLQERLFETRRLSLELAQPLSAEALAKLLGRGVASQSEITRLVEVGINHEQQHQELLLTDILALFAASPLRPAYRIRQQPPSQAAPETLDWIDFAGGIRQVGHDGKGFAWDNEAPRHDTLIHPFRLADRLVTCGEWLDFMTDGG